MIISDFIKWQESQTVASDFKNYLTKKYGLLSDVALDLATEVFQLANVIAHLDNKIDDLSKKKTAPSVVYKFSEGRISKTSKKKAVRK